MWKCDAAADASKEIMSYLVLIQRIPSNLLISQQKALHFPWPHYLIRQLSAN
jgi:hypothetical protein